MASSRQVSKATIGVSLSFHFTPINRQPVKAPAPSEANQTDGGTMISGGRNCLLLILASALTAGGQTPSPLPPRGQQSLQSLRCFLNPGPNIASLLQGRPSMVRRGIH